MESGSTIWKKSFPGSGGAAAAMRLLATGLLVILLFRLCASRHQRCNNVVTAVAFATNVIIAVLSMWFCLVEPMMKLVVCLNVTLAMLCGPYIVNFLPNVLKFV
jgi:hypothetical protein